MTQPICVAFYNIENLFDTVDDPFTIDDDFTPHGKKHWTPKRYQKKIRKLSYAIAAIGKEETNDAPAIIGLSEVENRHVLKDLINTELLKDEKFGIIHYNSPDERGIDVALIYQKEHFLPLHSEPITVNLTNDNGSPDYTRDILYVNGEINNQIVHIFVVHLPSKRNQDINQPKRIQIAQVLREKIDQIHQTETAPNIIVMGDFNENPDNQPLKQVLQTHAEPVQMLSNQMFNPMEALHKQNQGSLMHNNKWLLFDQILFSKAFLYQDSTIKLDSVHVFDKRFLQDWDEADQNEPFRTYAGRRYQNGYSDHFPVYAILTQ